MRKLQDKLFHLTKFSWKEVAVNNKIPELAQSSIQGNFSDT